MKAPTIDQYIERTARKLGPKGWFELHPRASRLLERAAQADSVRHPRLCAQASVLQLLLSSPGKKEIPPELASELAVAASYLLKGFDIIPDGVKEIGFDDDAVLLDRVFARNRDRLEEFLGDVLSPDQIVLLFP